MSINKDFKIYEIIFIIIAIIFIVINGLGLFEVIYFTNNAQIIFQTIFLVSIGIAYIRKSKVAGVLFIIASILFITSIL
ncbi:hypothetical protein NGH74_00740 [Staphylococcus pseudoxylosus]|uniref:hypothetical protein n=1 Tax=Staphylococcus pseudoxylosus TaxID=2282419 RepID=UPI000D1D58B2|nr:hypothetical protein [Staphylococcus pseudoxylosus]PTI45875.1 hypothetical protein BU120_03535 [Staphylococcus xylosus]MDW8797315.1 hypothetical protein [Staphylococcus pseudoxylosus]MEB6036345.1 hypothetical protein [Staphylococcus pseudoxylosus]MEB7754367.1 hypothetical protein [Staphylococcus pseudoxylosus]MEB7763717.1 hypothetical protein [Staphylococcus pseudoxylosus]